ncbi:unnamed protein product [Didymodactylos carnosus]|uniref:Uncharacterized protein n=1 Tax=Didymodactylos carnosus TaxID=1234261 RepID=A0A814DCR8_9BILA|nr:unnamed protein product [Didymodactylos carnosus]CAF1106545.1 unnamed protein product [Didymodactylos carnosus]CAF3728970.1 unnamed protein product [Didymodactylos carnosus]CAF3870408.1 unnamed protein product [Didymodactylos carnosus]
MMVLKQGRNDRRLFLTMKTTIGQPPANCVCYPPNHGPSPPPPDIKTCNTRGCSRGSNPYCYIYPLNLGRNNYYNYRGCNCPYYSYDHVIDNGAYYNFNGFPTFYNYTTCTDFGSNARDAHGNVPPDGNNAIDCCNFCCDPNDPTTITTDATTITTTAITTDATTIITTDATTIITTTTNTNTTTIRPTSGYNIVGVTKHLKIWITSLKTTKNRRLRQGGNFLNYYASACILAMKTVRRTDDDYMQAFFKAMKCNINVYDATKKFYSFITIKVRTDMFFFAFQHWSKALDIFFK